MRGGTSVLAGLRELLPAVGRHDRGVQRADQRVGREPRLLGLRIAVGPNEPSPFRCPSAARATTSTTSSSRGRAVWTACRTTTTRTRSCATAAPASRTTWSRPHAVSATTRTCALVRPARCTCRPVDGHGFAVTPFRAETLATWLGLTPAGGVWVKDETGNVSGSHKARHLIGVLIHLEVMEDVGLRTPAAADPASRSRAAATRRWRRRSLAAGGRWAARRLRATWTPTGLDPEPGWTSFGPSHRLRPRPKAAPAIRPTSGSGRRSTMGAIPFTCQGNDNGLAIEGGETLGYELADATREPAGDIDRPDRDPGRRGGARQRRLQGLARWPSLWARWNGYPAFHTVQTARAPPARASLRMRRRRCRRSRHWRPDSLAVAGALAERRRVIGPRSCGRGRRAAAASRTGILDDETYDWRAVVRGHARDRRDARSSFRRGHAGEANDARGDATTEIDVDPTGSAGLAGPLELMGTDGSERTIAWPCCSRAFVESASWCPTSNSRRGRRPRCRPTSLVVTASLSRSGRRTRSTPRLSSPSS